MKQEETNIEYCAECGIILTPGEYDFSYQYVTCVPCGQKCCDRGCLAEHKRHCAGACEAKDRRASKPREKR